MLRLTIRLVPSYPPQLLVLQVTKAVVEDWEQGHLQWPVHYNSPNTNTVLLPPTLSIPHL